MKEMTMYKYNYCYALAAFESNYSTAYKMAALLQSTRWRSNLRSLHI